MTKCNIEQLVVHVHEANLKAFVSLVTQQGNFGGEVIDSNHIRCNLKHYL